MSKLVRMVLPILLVAFAATSAWGAARDSAMVVTMALSDGGAMDAADCGGGGDDGPAATPCDTVCTSSPAAVVSGLSVVLLSAVSYRSPETVYGLVGRAGPPDPYPPRISILS